MTFFVGLHMLAHLHRFERCMVNINRLERRVSDIEVNEWIMDSGAFTEISKYGRHRRSVETYAQYIRRWSRCGTLLAAVSQDWMCEPQVIERTGLSVEEHQKRTLKRYDALRKADTGGTYIMPVVQGYSLSDYYAHAKAYRSRVKPNAWIGVGSVCKRNRHPAEVAAILQTVKKALPDVRLHGFGIKKTALAYAPVREMLHTADSMAWSWAARQEGRDANCWREAKRYIRSMKSPQCHGPLFQQ